MKVERELSARKFTSFSDKEAFVQGVFSNVAKHYDIMNTILSFHQDAYWRRFAVKQLGLQPGNRLLDVACGTGMLTKEALRQEPTLSVEALDFSPEMLQHGEQRLAKAGLLDRVNLVEGDAMSLRNVPDVMQALKEMKRVVKPGGRVVTLELAKPTAFGFKQLYYLYFEHILPVLGKLSKDNSSYAWLPESLRRYPHQSQVLTMFEEAGYKEATYYELTGGIVAVHVGVVPEEV